MAVDTQAVQIRIDVVDNNSAAAVKGVEQNIQNMGAAGTTSGDKVAKGMDQIKGHSLTALDNVRLLRDDIGVRIPRSMEKAIASSQTMMTVIGGIGTGLLALGAIDIGVRIGKGLYDAYEKWFSLSAAVEKYQEEVDKTKDQDFGNTSSIETTRLRIDEATEAMKGYAGAARELDQKANHSVLHALDPAAPYMSWQAHSMMETSLDWQRKLDALKDRLPEQQHKGNLDEIELGHAGDASLRGEQKRTAELQKQLEINKENARFENQRQGVYGNPVNTNALWTTGKLSEGQTQDLIAERKAEADTFNLRREQGIELQHMREAALEAGLRGVALYKAQEAAAIAELTNKDLDSVAARKYVHDKFHAEELRRLEDETRATEKMERAAAAAGTTGIAKARREGEGRIADVHDSDFQDVDANGRSALAERQRVSIARETDGQITEERRAVAEEINRITDASAAHQVSGFERITAEASRQIDELRAKVETVYGKMPKIGPPSSDQAAGARLIQQGIIGINAGAARETTDLIRKNADETEQIEAEARQKSLSAERQKTASIESEYEARFDKYEEWKRQELGSDKLTADERASIIDNANRREVAAAQERDAEMVEASRQAREKMAGEFSSFFKSLDHPTEALKNLGDKVAGEAAAGLMQRIQQRGQRGAPAPQAQQGGIFGDILGGFGLGGKKTVPAPESEPSISHAHGSVAAANKDLRIAMAQIRIDNASFAGVGGGAPSATGFTNAGSAIPGIAGAGTSLLAPGGAIARATYTGESAPTWSGAGTTSSSSPWSTGAGVGDVAGTALAAGGSGDASRSPAVSNFNTGSGVPPPPGQNKPAGIMSDLSQGMGLFKGAKNIFGHGGSGTGTSDQYAETQDSTVAGQFDKNGNFVAKGSTNGGMLGGGGIGANAMGAAGGALGMYSAYEGNGGVGGALSGAMSGMQLGMALGGPIGAGIGAAAGAIMGAIGFGGREKARVYDLKQVRPRLKNDIDGYQQGTMDYLGAYSDIEGLSRDANMTTNAMGPAAKSYYQDTIKKEIKDAEGKLTAEQRAGRSQYTTSAAQFDIGADSVPRDGMAMIHQRERIIPSDQNERITRALEGGSGTMPVQSQGFGGDVHLHVHTMDARGVQQFLDQHKHHIRAAVNASFAENSGGADA